MTETLSWAIVAYRDLGTPASRIRRLERLMNQRLSPVARERIQTGGRWLIEIRGRRRGLFTDFAHTLEDARQRAREIVACRSKI